MTCGIVLSRLGSPSYGGAPRAKDADELAGGRMVQPVLVVDDEAAVRSITARMLTSEGYEVITAESGQEALERLTEYPDIKVAVIDVIMPQMNGLVLAAKMPEVAPECRVILMTGYAPDQIGLGTLGLHLPVLKKPFTTFQLVDQIRQALRDGRH